jgi:hypothetical protein
MADFKVAYSNGTNTSYSGENAGCEVDDTSAVLTVLDGKGKQFRFSPAAWLCIEEDEPQSVYEARGLETV